MLVFQCISVNNNTNVKMNSGYFTSRNDILEWINSLLGLQLTKIEQLGSGSVYCHLLDAAYPGKVPMGKVKWNAYLEVDFLHNFKILQTCFQKLGIKKVIETQKLVKAKYQDNLEFIQWMKWFLASTIKDSLPYDAQARRNHCDVHLLFTDRKEGRKEKKGENKENVDTSKGGPALKSYKSLEQIKMQPFNESSLRKAFEKGESLRALLDENPPHVFPKTKKRKLQVTLKSSTPLHDRLNLQQQCF